MGKSAYQAQFVDWGVSSVPPVVTTNTVRSVPFEGKSLYSETFVPIDPKNRAHPMKQLCFFQKRINWQKLGM